MLYVLWAMRGGVSASHARHFGYFRIHKGPEYDRYVCQV
jgi:hypothetical protein